MSDDPLVDEYYAEMEPTAEDWADVEAYEASLFSVSHAEPWEYENGRPER